MSEVIYKGASGASAEHKPMSAFHPLKELPEGTKIEGVHKGRFESKKKTGYFFHVFEHTNGESHAYGTCKVLDERINEYTSALKELNLKPEEAIFSVTFLGRLKNKNNDKSSYKFTAIEIQKNPNPSKPAPEATTVTSDDIPF